MRRRVVSSSRLEIVNVATDQGLIVVFRVAWVPQAWERPAPLSTLKTNVVPHVVERSASHCRLWTLTSNTAMVLQLKALTLASATNLQMFQMRTECVASDCN